MQRETIGTSRLKAPDDGIVSSHRPRGWLGTRWLELVESIARDSRNGRSRGARGKVGALDYRPARPGAVDGEDRIARGRSWARSGRVRDLWFSPGIANAEVVAPDAQQVSIRVRVFDESEWERAIGLLGRNLKHIAGLIQGELSSGMVELFASAGLPLLPTPSDLEGTCGCDDFALPCAHVAAVHHVLADALEGEPFLLLTLRGRSREQVLAALRRAWGDPEPFRASIESAEEPPPAGDWYHSPAPLPAIVFSFPDSSRGAAPAGAAGLLELGSPPGDDGLERALRPLYEAGGRAALELALREENVGERRLRRRARARAPEEQPPRTSGSEKEEKDDMASTDQAAPARNADRTNAPSGNTLTERLVDELARVESAKSKELAKSLGVTMLEIRNELLELEKLGIVYRTGQTRGTRWWLG